MNTEHYKAASERTDADERALIPAFKRTAPLINSCGMPALQQPPDAPAPNKAQHSQWFGVYDKQGKLRATFDSEPEAYFYIRNRGHVNGGTYKAIESEVQP